MTAPGGTILIVDDEPVIRGLLAQSLTLAGFRVIEARNGAEALTRFDSTVDLLLTDMRMPYVSGGELITQLRARRRTLPIVAISGYPMNEPALPDITFLAKPFTRDALLEAVNAAIHGGR